MAANENTSDSGLPVSCECGYISFRTPSSTPLGTAHCHCTSCRKQSASMFGTSVYFPADKVFPLPDDLNEKLSVFTHPADSGNTMHCYFCPRCGVRIFHAAVLPDGSLRPAVSFKGGAIDGGINWEALDTKHIFTKSAVMKIPEGWTCFQEGPPQGVLTTGGQVGGSKKKEE